MNVLVKKSVLLHVLMNKNILDFQLKYIFAGRKLYIVGTSSRRAKLEILSTF